MDRDVLKTLGGGLGLAGKLMGRGVDEMTKAIRKPDDSQAYLETGLFYSAWEARDSAPRVRFYESQEKGRLNVNMVKNLTMSAGERDFLAGVSALLSGQTQEATGRLREATKRGDSKVQLTDAYFLLGGLLICQPQATAESLHEAGRLLKTGLLAQQALGKSLRRYAPSLHVALPLTQNSCFCIYPDLLGLNLLLALAQRKSDPQESVHTLEQFLEIVPNEPVALFFVNLFRWQTGDYREIFQSLARTLPDSNLQVACMVLLGKACQALGDPTTGREIFRKALQRQDLDHTLKMDLRTALADALKGEGYLNDAEHELATVQQESPGYRRLEERLGVTPSAPAPPQEPARPSDSARPLEPTAAEPLPPTPMPLAKPTRQLPTGPPDSAAPTIDPEGSVSRLSSIDGNLDFMLNRARVLIGRDEGDIRLGDKAASKLHAEITYEDGLYWIEDKGSTNGTWVNRHPIKRRVELHRGDVIQIGESLIQVC